MDKTDTIATDKINKTEKTDFSRYVRLAQRGDDDAFIFLFKEYEKLIYRIAYTYLGNEDDALDAVQETAYRSYKNIKSLRNPEYFKAWLCRIASNASVDILKTKRQNENSTVSIEEVLDMIDNTQYMRDKPQLTPMEFVDLLPLLSDDEKNILLLKIYYDYTFEMIAEENNQPVGTVKTAYYRLIKKLRLKGAEIL